MPNFYRVFWEKSYGKKPLTRLFSLNYFLKKLHRCLEGSQNISLVSQLATLIKLLWKSIHKSPDTKRMTEICGTSYITLSWFVQRDRRRTPIVLCSTEMFRICRITEKFLRNFLSVNKIFQETFNTGSLTHEVPVLPSHSKSIDWFLDEALNGLKTEASAHMKCTIFLM